MTRRALILGLAFLAALTGLVLARAGGGVRSSQFLPDDLSQREMWEEFLAAAEIVGRKQLKGSEAVTEPWVLTLKKGALTRRAIWKNAQGRQGGFWEGWNYEVAAYLLDKHLGLGMVPPTIERRFDGEKGSCQLWIEDCMTLRDREEKRIKMPIVKVFGWNRATYIQRLWDNLIANEDRHMNQILITPDWRMVLIDHSRSFRSSPRFTKSLLFTARNPDGPKLMSELPRALVDKVKALDAASLKAATRDYLSEIEVTAVLLRRDLILQEIDKLVKASGEAKVFY